MLHCQEQTAELTSDKCISELEKHLENYKKGTLDSSLKKILSLNKDTAIKRAKSLNANKNPSTSIYVLIEKLDAEKKDI
uniref:Uncharacterized protein n=1 Tax=uncultured bacterium contig00046 TaxID=1181532 RepID=A0A806JY38_9BACT|nr:hypothetical protein [uncultured bacterium contig00046]